jgi:hypothetical protein
MTTYFGFAMADGMFPGECAISRKPLTPEQVRGKLEGAVICLNPSHKPTIEAARSRFGLPITIPEKAPTVSLGKGDSLLVMAVRGLLRLEGRHEYTPEEIGKAEFAFGEWTVVEVFA